MAKRLTATPSDNRIAFTTDLGRFSLSIAEALTLQAELAYSTRKALEHFGIEMVDLLTLKDSDI